MISDPNKKSREIIDRLMKFIEQHWAEKLSLEDIAQYTHYNRTYVSTLFKNAVGINFHDYLTKVRLSNAIFQLAVTDKNMTQIALDCGFSDLKTFNHRFRDIFGYLPAEYKQRLDPAQVMQLQGQQVYVSPQDPSVAAKLAEYMDVWRGDQRIRALQFRPLHQPGPVLDNNIRTQAAGGTCAHPIRNLTEGGDL